MAGLLAGLVLRIWAADIAVPFAYGFETQYYLMIVKGILEHGGYFVNPSLGAPFGQELHDLAIGTDSLHLVLIEALGLFSSDAAVVTNVFFLLTFPLTGATAYLAFRLLHVSRATSIVCAVLYALLPYHFVRGEGHLFLSAYYVVPLGAYLVLAVGAGEPLFRRRPGARPLFAFATARSLAIVACCVVVASGGIYYAGFTLVLLVPLTALAYVVSRRASTLANGGAVIALVAATILVNLLPTLRYQDEHGRNPALTASRPPQHSELYGLKLTDLVFPIHQHRLRPFAELTARYKGGTVVGSEPGQSLGLVGTVGFLSLLVGAFLAVAGRRLSGVPPLARAAAAAVLTAVLVGTVSGGGTVLAYLVRPEFRAWNRISVFIAFFALFAVALLLDALRRRLRSALLRGVVLAATLAFGVYDQTTPKYVPPYNLKAEYEQERDFVEAIERTLPDGATVFQLPYSPFPEAPPIVDMADFDLLRGYVHSHDLRWSYGAMKGRPEDWGDDLASWPLSFVIPAVAAAGFDGIYVDRYAYQDRAVGLERRLRAQLGVDPLVASSARHSFFDLRPFSARLQSERQPSELEALRVATLRPLAVSPGPGLWALEDEGERTFRWAVEPRVELFIENTSTRTREVRLETIVAREGDTPAEVEVTAPDRSVVRLDTAARNKLDLSVALRPGTNVVRFETASPPLSFPGDPRRLFFQLVDVRLTDLAFLPFLFSRQGELRPSR